MTKIVTVMENSVLILDSTKVGWNSFETLKGQHPQAIAFDQKNRILYCGTYDNGLLKSEDEGHKWERIGKKVISSSIIMSVAVNNRHETTNGSNMIYAGTEPSALYTSKDAGESWEELKGLNNLGSSNSWSFPPRPYTHHVRWIEPDVNNSDFIFVAIEAGALVQSRDGGRTWIDRVKDSPFDTHVLRTHGKAPRRLYSAAGDGYFESLDYGETWTSPMEGLEHRYLWGIAIDSANPESVIVSAALSAFQAHYFEHTNSVIYLRSRDGDDWQIISKGLPEADGTIITMLASNPFTNGEFYGINNRGIFCSTDGGVSWHELDIPWSKEYTSQHPWGISVIEQ
jgi:photosystem II stability/assembly factor-like uncharacterized protein